MLDVVGLGWVELELIGGWTCLLLRVLRSGK